MKWERDLRAELSLPRTDVGQWPGYDDWNHSIANTFFDGRHAGRTVYLDMEDDILKGMAEVVGVDKDVARENLVETVASTLSHPRSEGRLLQPHVDRARGWARRPVGPPPSIALLGVLSLAADQMGVDDEFVASNYYARFVNLLGWKDLTKKELQRVGNQYREDALELWATLNEWLERHEGSLGVASAYAPAGSFTHIGPAISQALLKAGDRAAILRFFQAYDLPAGALIPSEDMARLFDEWLDTSRSSVTSTLARIWRRGGDVQSRIAELITRELEEWDGTVDAFDDGASPESRSRSGSLRLSGGITSLFGRRLQLRLVTSLAVGPASLRMGGAEGSIEVRLDGKTAEHRTVEGIDSDDLLTRHMSLRADGVEAERTPRRVVVLRYDEMLGSYVERARIQLAEDVILLVHENIADRVGRVLESFARPGSSRHDALAGLPGGWVLFEDVQLLEAPDVGNTADLQVLVPVAWRQMVLAGGVSLPGRVRRWHRYGLPEIRISSVGRQPFSVTVTRAGDAAPTCSWGPFDDAVVLSPTPKDLEEGDYRVEAREADATFSTATLRIRSARNARVDADIERPTPLFYNLSSPLGLLSPGLVWDVGLQGARLAWNGQEALVPSGGPPEVEPYWLEPKPDEWAPSKTPESERRSSDGGADTPKCFTSGHYFQLPTFDGQITSSRVRNECRDCGLVEWTPSRPRRKRKPGGTSDAGPSLDIASLRAVRRHGDVNMGRVLDGLSHLQYGPWSWFERLIRQEDDSALRVYLASRELEALGHIDIERNAADLRPLSWQISPTTLNILPSGSRAVLCGWRSVGLVHHLNRLVRESRGRLDIDKDHAPQAVFVDGLTPTQLHEIARKIASESPTGVQVASDVSLRASASLVPLIGAAEELRDVPVPTEATFRRFHPESASWVRARPSVAGAYKVELPGRSSNVYRSQQDVLSGRMRPAPQDVVKHLDAARRDRPLMAYREGQQVLLAPERVGLPGIVERIAVLCHGRLPFEAQGVRVYRGVPVAVAIHIHRALKGKPIDDAA